MGRLLPRIQGIPRFRVSRLFPPGFPVFSSGISTVSSFRSQEERVSPDSQEFPARTGHGSEKDGKTVEHSWKEDRGACLAAGEAAFFLPAVTAGTVTGKRNEDSGTFQSRQLREISVCWESSFSSSPPPPCTPGCFQRSAGERRAKGKTIETT